MAELLLANNTKKEGRLFTRKACMLQIYLSKWNFILKHLKMTDVEVLQLDIWKGDWGLPSVNIECLQVLVCILYIGYKTNFCQTSL